MPSSAMSRVLHSLRRAALRSDGGDLSDGQMLERFLTARDEAAFEALVRRHGPMVLGVCRRILNNHHDAEDAFQATFLVLVRKASSIMARETVGNWLYGVAYRTAQKARVAATRRRVKEKQMSRSEVFEEDVWRELRPVLDEELNRLPEKFREPVVLCDLEGHTHKDAAARLGWPAGTLSVRLSQARTMLAKRLARRGLILTAGTVATALCGNAATAGVPAPLVSSTVQAAVLVAAGGAVSAPVAALTAKVLQAMLVAKLRIVVAIALVPGLLAAGCLLYLTATWAGAPTPAAPPVQVAAAAPVPVPGKEEDKKPDAKVVEKTTLPVGASLLVQVLVSLDNDGKLVVKQAIIVNGQLGAIRPEVAPPDIGANGAPSTTEIVTRTQTFGLDDVQILDNKGNKVDKKELAKLLPEETMAMASLNGRPVDPLHLRLFKEGTLTFILPPAPKDPRLKRREDAKPVPGQAPPMDGPPAPQDPRRAPRRVMP
jgi:RNA polymerase sigma factor (sigma-70 family)